MNVSSLAKSSHMITMRKNGSMLNHRENNDKNNSSVVIKGKNTNYSFSIKDDKNFFKQFPKNIKLIKNFHLPKNNQKYKEDKIHSFPNYISGKFKLI